MWLTVLIVIAALWAMTVWALLIIVQVKSRSSTPSSPTQSSTPTPTSDAAVLSENFLRSLEQVTKMAETLTLGRESQSQTGQTETQPMYSVRPSEYDYDSTPLSPGIEAILEREESEDEPVLLLREREELQRKLTEAQSEMARFDLENYSQDPHLEPEQNGSAPKHARKD